MTLELAKSVSRSDVVACSPDGVRDSATFIMWEPAINAWTYSAYPALNYTVALLACFVDLLSPRDSPWEPTLTYKNGGHLSRVASYVPPWKRPAFAVLTAVLYGSPTLLDAWIEHHLQLLPAAHFVFYATEPPRSAKIRGLLRDRRATVVFWPRFFPCSLPFAAPCASGCGLSLSLEL